MWKDIIIGNGEKECSATICWIHNNSEWCYVSHNRNAYWINMPDILDKKGMTIYKDTKEAKRITQLLTAKQDQKLNDFLFKLFLKKIKPEVIINLIKSANSEGIREGKEMKQLELQRVLGL
jgi:hypothetical protein